MPTDPFEVFRGADGRWYWRMKAANGETIAQSEGYERRQGALDGIEAVKANAAPAAAPEGAA